MSPSRRRLLFISGVFVLGSGVAAVATGQALLWRRSWHPEHRSYKADDQPGAAGPASSRRPALHVEELRPRPVDSKSLDFPGGHPSRHALQLDPVHGQEISRTADRVPHRLSLVMRRRKAELTADQKGRLVRVATGVMAMSGTCRVIGVASEHSLRRRNVRLARKRMKLVAHVLEQAGLDRERMVMRWNVARRGVRGLHHGAVVLVQHRRRKVRK